jgi:hypothetical protein
MDDIYTTTTISSQLQQRCGITHTIGWWVVQAAAMDDSTTAAAVVVTIVIRHEKTWVMMAPERNDASLVHDDDFYPRWDVTIV